MVYVQYFERGAVTGELIETCGDRGVVILDGRSSLENMHNDAVEFNGFRRPVYAAYQIFKGPSFTRATPITGIVKL